MVKPHLADQVARNQSALDALSSHQEQRAKQEKLLAEEQKKNDRLHEAWRNIRSFIRGDDQTVVQFLEEWAKRFLELGCILNDLGWQRRLEDAKSENPIERLALCIYQSSLLQDENEVLRLLQQGFSTAKGNDQNILNELLRRRIMEHLTGRNPHPIGQRYANCEDQKCPSCARVISPLTYESCQFCFDEIIRRRNLPLDPITTLKVELLKARALSDVTKQKSLPLFLSKNDEAELPRLGQPYASQLWLAMERFSSQYLANVQGSIAIPQQPVINTQVAYTNALSIAEAWIQNVAKLRPDLVEMTNNKSCSLIDFNAIINHLKDELNRCEEILRHPRYNGIDAAEERKWLQAGDSGLMILFWSGVQKDYRSLPFRYLVQAPSIPCDGLTYDRTIEEIRLHLTFIENLKQANPELDLQMNLSDQYPKEVKSKPKRSKSSISIESSDMYEAIISALIQWHKYKDGGVGNLEPKKLSDLAREKVASKGTLSNFFRDKFKSYRAYASMCRRNDGALLFSLKLLNGDVSPHNVLSPDTLS